MGRAGVGLSVSAGRVGKLSDGALGPMLIPAVVAVPASRRHPTERFCPKFDLRTGSVIQFVPTAIVTAVAVALWRITGLNGPVSFVFALGWLVLVLSLGAISLLNPDPQRQRRQCRALFCLPPPTTA
ncbi:MAG: hypothetical protein IPF44_03155 [Betaproteobacteria bacterium]|nr:hypothetical protein [Betaproteobacteria bacterium]